eukprot:160530-Prymnesium_polylepis.2
MGRQHVHRVCLEPLVHHGAREQVEGVAHAVARLGTHLQPGNQAIRQSGNQAIRQPGNQAIRQSGPVLALTSKCIKSHASA